MRVLIASDSYLPYGGGLERAVHALAEGLATSGVDVSLATLANPGAARDEEVDGVHVRRLDGWSRHLRRFADDPTHLLHPTVPDPALVRRLQQIVDAERPDVVHVHGWMLHSALLLRLPPGTALVTTLHDYGLTCAKRTLIHRDEWDTPCPGPSPVRCLRCAAEHYGAVKGTVLTLGLAESLRRLDRVDLFLPVSTAVGARVPAAHAARVRVIPPFLPDADMSEIPSGRTDVAPAGDYVIFVGAVALHKGIDTLIDAFRLAGLDASLLVLGPQTGQTPPVARLSGDGVVVHGPVPHQQVMAALGGASVAVVPSRWAEPFGLVAVEAMAAGTPVVASRIGGLSDIVTPQTGLLVPPGDVGALAAALSTLMADPELRRRLGAAGPASAARFTATAVIPQVLDAYRQAIGLSWLRRSRRRGSPPPWTTAQRTARQPGEVTDGAASRAR